MATKLDTVEARDRLKPRSAPYWQKLSTGCALGFRKMRAASTGTWLAQAYDNATRKQTRRSLGEFDSLPKNKRFDEAKKAAEALFDRLNQGGSAHTIDVRKACENYVSHVRATNAKAADDIAARFERHVYKEKIASIDLPKLTRKHVEAWRRALATKPVKVDPYAKEPRTRTRAPSSINRDMTPLRAALNHAHDNGDATNDMAWRVALRPLENADGQRDVYLDRTQRSGLIAAAPTDLAAFLKGMSLVPLRPGALALLTVSRFDKRLSVLAIGKDKAGADRKIKLPTDTAAFFAEAAKDKLPGARLFTQANGKPWTKDVWKKLIKPAAETAGLPDAVVVYAMRHSVITDLVTGGLDLLTIAQLSGTSVEMIEKHYGHLRRDHAAAALATLAL
jgi:site-specific recombinase XerD